MTRHQTWKARERARFRLIAETVRTVKALDKVAKRGGLIHARHTARMREASVDYNLAQSVAALRGIPEVFVG